MRVRKYLIKKKISLKTLNTACEYLFIERFRPNSKINDATLILLDNVIGTSEFEEYYRIKRSSIAFDLSIAKELRGKIMEIPINSIDELISERIINALSFINRYSFELNNYEINVLKNEEISNLEKVKLLMSPKVQQLPDVLKRVAAQMNYQIKGNELSSHKELKDFLNEIKLMDKDVFKKLDEEGIESDNEFEALVMQKQKNIRKKYLELFDDETDEKSDNSYSGMHWGGLDDEEASLGYWNTE